MENKKLKKNFYQNGYLHFKSFFLKKEIKEQYTKLKEIGNKSNLNRMINPHRKIKVILNLYKNKKIIKFVEYLLKKEIKGLQSEFFINPKGTIGHPPHQDDYFLKTGPNNSLNAWIPLVRTNKKNGALKFYLKSHLDGLKTKLNNVSLNNKNYKKINLLKKYKTKIISCNIGDIIFISNQIFHGSGNNHSNKNRFVVAFGYIKKGSKYNKGKTAKRRLTNFN